MDPANGSGDEGFADEEVVEDNAMETAVSAEGEDELLESSKATTYFCTDAEDSSKPGQAFTKSEIEKVMCLEPYKRKLGTCHMCGQCWFDDQTNSDCVECGGYAMQRPCPICDGGCGSVWERNTKISHTFHKARWEGSCKLPADMQQAFIKTHGSDANDDSLAEVMQDLSTS